MRAPDRVLTRRPPSSVVALLVASLSFAGCTDPVPNEAELARGVAEHLPQVRGLELKRGVPQFDPHAAWILAQGRSAAPYLVEHLVDDRRSATFEYFQFAHGDVAHALLCEIYDRPFMWPLPDREPIGGHPTLTFQDYVAFVREPGARERMRAMWAEFLAAR